MNKCTRVGIICVHKKMGECVMRKKALLVTSVLIVILALVLVSVIGCTPEEKTYAVTLNLGDETEVRNLTDLEVAPVAPTKDGYEFDDWYTDAELQNKATFPMPLESDITLYAKYLQKFTLTLVSPGSDNTTQSVAKLKLAPTAPEREGYTFLGWYLDSGYKNAVTYPYVLEKDTTFYARWSTGGEGGFTVKFVTNGGTPVEEMVCTRIEKLPVTTKSGMVFAGWYTSKRLAGNPVSFPYNVTKDLTLYAKWVEDEGDKEYEYIKEYKNAKSSLEAIFDLLPDPQKTATLDLQTTMTTDSGTAQIDMQGNFTVGGKNEFMFRVTMLDKTTFAVYFIGNDMYMDLGDGNPLVHFSDIKPDYVVAFLGDLLVDLDVDELLDMLKDKIGGIDIAGTLINLLFNSPYYTATKRLADNRIINESYQFEIKLNSLVSSINTLIGMFDIGSLIGINLNLTPLFDWLNSNIPQLKVYMYADTKYDETINKTVVTSMQLVAEDNDPNNDVDGEVFNWMVDKADIRTTDPINFTDVIADIENDETRDFSLSNIQFDVDLQLYSDENGLDVAKLVNLFAPDSGLPEDTLVLHSEFGYRIKANVDLDLNYLNSEDDNNLISLEIYAVDESGNIILNDKVPMLLGIYYRNGSLYVSLNSMMPNYWKADNIRIDGINLKGVVSYLVEMVTTAIDEYFGTNWDDYKTGAKELALSQSGRDIVTVAEDESTGEEVVYISPTIQTLITAVASIVGFEECLYANDDQIVVEVNQKLFAAINQFMGENPIELPIALDGKVALNMFDKGLESVEISATVGVPDKDAEGNNVVDENGNIVTSDPIEVGLKLHNFMLGFTQNEFIDSDATSLAEYIDEKLALTNYESNLGNLLGSVLSGVDLNARAKVTFNEGTYAIGKFLEGLGLKELEGVPLEWKFTEDFYMNVGLSIMISIDRNTRANSMFAIEITALEDINVGGMTGMDKGTVMLGVYGFYTQDTSSGTGEWKPHILLDMSNVKIMNITLPKLSLEFDFVQTLLDLFDNIKIGDQLLSDFDLEFDIMSLFGGNDSTSGDASESALFAESDGTAAGTTLSEFGSIVLGLNAEKIYASLTLGAVGMLLNKMGVDLGGFDLSTIDLALDMDITRTEGWTITASGELMQPEEADQPQNLLMEIEIGTKEYPLTVGYVRDKLTETKNRVEAEVDSYTDDLIQAIIDTVGYLSIDVTMDLATYDSHIDFTKIINNILVSQGQYLDLPIDMYLDDWNSVSTLTLKWDLDLEVVTNSKLLLAFNYGEKEIISLGITGGDIIVDLSGLGLFAFKLSNSNLVSLLMGYIDDMIADIGNLNLTDIINGLLNPEDDVQLDEVAGDIAQGLHMAEPTAEEGSDIPMDLIMMLLTGVRAEDVSLFVDLTAPTIDKIFSSLLGIGLGFDIDLGLELDMVDGELNLDLGLSDVVDFRSEFKLQVGKQGTDDDFIVNTSVPDIDASTGASMAKTLLDNLDIAVSIDVLSNNIDTGGSAKYLRLSVEKLKSQRVLSDAANTPTIPAGAFLVTIARVNSDSDFNDTTSTSNTKALAYLVLNYNTGKMSVYLAKNNISLVVDLGDYVAIDIDLDLVTTLGNLFQGLIDQIDAAAYGTNEISTASEGGAEEVALAEGDTTEEPSPFAELFADLDVLKLLNGGIDVRLTSAGVFNIDVSFNPYEINKLIDGVMSLIFGPNTILNLAELAPDMFGNNYLANVNWDRVNNDSRGFWQTLQAQLTPMLREVVTNMVSSALAPLITDTLLNSTYDVIHDILMRLLPLPVFNRLNVGITTLDGTFSNIYIKGYDDDKAVVDDDGKVLSNTTYNGGERKTEYNAGTRNASYKTEIYLFNKSASVGSEDNTVSGESTPGVVDWGDITLSVNYEPYEYSGNFSATTPEEIAAASAASYNELYNKYFANKTARYQYNTTVQKSDVTFYIATKSGNGELVKGEKLTSSTVNLLNVWQIAKDAAARGDTAATTVYVIGSATFSGDEKTLEIAVNVMPANEIRSIIPIETHAYDAIVDDITIEFVTGETRDIRTEEMDTFSYSANTFTAHSKQVNVKFKNGVEIPMTVNFIDSTVADIVGGGSEPRTYEIDLYDFTANNRTIDQFTPEYLYIRYADGATSRIAVDQWVVPTESAQAIENKAQNDMTYVSVPVEALIAQSTAAAQSVTLTVNIKTKVISALGLGSTLDSLEINPYTYFLNMIGYSEETIKPDTAVAYYYEDRDGKIQSYNEQVNVLIDISTDTEGNQFNEQKLSYQSEGRYGGTVSLDTYYYGARRGVDPDTEGYDALEGGYFKWSKDITVNVVKNSIIAVYFDEELTEEIFTIHPYEYNALDEAGKLAYFPSTAWVKFSSNAVMKMPIRWYDGGGNLLDPLTYVPDYESYSEQWQIEIGFMTDEFSAKATANGIDPQALEANFLQKTNVGVFVDGMEIEKLNIPGAGSGDDYYEVDPIQVLYLGKDAFPSSIEVTYTDGSTAEIGVYKWVGVEDIEFSMAGSDVREITVMLTKDGLNNYTIRYKVVAKSDPVYAYDELVLDPFGYVNVTENGQTVRTYQEFGTTLDVVFDRVAKGPEVEGAESNVVSVNVAEWDFTGITFTSGSEGEAVAKVAKSDGTYQNVTVPVRMKKIATKENGQLDLSYAYYGYDFMAVMYDTDSGVYFANFSEEIRGLREGYVDLMMTYWCEGDLELYEGEITEDIADDIVTVTEGDKVVNYIKVYTTRQINVYADFTGMPQNVTSSVFRYYLEDNPVDSPANVLARENAYDVPVTFTDGGGNYYEYTMKGMVCVLGVSGTNTDASSANTGVSEGN